MFQNNLLLAELKRQLHQAAPRVEGIVKIHPKGFGFLELDNKKNYFIPAAKMEKLLDGDRVKGTIEVRGDKKQFEPETIVESALTQFIGTVAYINERLVVYPHHPMIKQAIFSQVSESITTKVQTGHRVVATLSPRSLGDHKLPLTAEITEIFDNQYNTLIPWLHSLIQYDLPYQAPPLTTPITISDDEKLDRYDLNHIAFFSIDNQNTKDIDDTVHIKLTEDNHFELTVAIADPSAYIPENSSLDLVAKRRLFSIYLPDFNIPMLPTEIIDDICSLVPHKQRAAVICRLKIDQEGNIVSPPYFGTAWVTSRAKLSYDAVSDHLEHKKKITIDSITEQLTLLATLARIRNSWRKKHALLFKEKNDYKFVLNDKKEVVDIIKCQKRIANQMVEEAMVMVNYAFADFITPDKWAIFNVHSGFDSKHLDAVIKILDTNDIKEFDKQKLASLEGYCALRRQLSNHTHVEKRILRYQTTADLSLKPAPHFGLGFKRYTTWTSPLRKYSDLTNHRLLKAIVRKQSQCKPNESWLKMAGERRKRLRLAERDLTNYLYRQFFSDKINHVFSAEVIDINKSGAKVRLIDSGAIAFMPLSLIHAKRKEITSDQGTGEVKINKQTLFKIADKITVLLRGFKCQTHSFIVAMQPM